MLTVTPKPLTATDMEVSVTYDGSDGSAQPVFVAINEFDQSGNLLRLGATASPLGYHYTFHNLKPATTYFYQLVVTFNLAVWRRAKSVPGTGTTEKQSQR
jgi:phosphodiesterase/alkaline phosphatase D-like protein